MLAAAILFTTTPIQPINFDDFSLRRARTLDGQRLLVTSWLGNRPTPGMAQRSSAPTILRTESSGRQF